MTQDNDDPTGGDAPKAGDGSVRSETGGGPKGPIVDQLRPALPKRFYRAVEARAVAAGADRYHILLDGRPIRTPLKRVLEVPGAARAAAIAAEWAAQETVIDPGRMPVTRIVNSALDAVADNMPAVADDLAAYAGSDLLCYRAEHPVGLVARQVALWDPLLAMIERDLGITFVRTVGVSHEAQPEPTLRAVRAALDPLEGLVLAGLHVITTLTGSAVLALAFLRGYAGADAIWEAAHVDEDWQIGQWGSDAEAAERRAQRRREFDAAALIVRGTGPDGASSSTTPTQ